MSDDEKCRIVYLADGPVRVRGDRELNGADLAALGEIVRAAKEKMAAMPPGPLDFTCPTCHQPAGEFCRKLSSGRVISVHPARRTAVAAGVDGETER